MSQLTTNSALVEDLLAKISDGVKYESKLRLAVNGLSGHGKTFTALALAKLLCEKVGKDAYILVADSERRSALKYADVFQFAHLPLPDHRIETYLAVIDVAERLNAQRPVVLVIDSGSHYWMGDNGALEEVAAFTESNRTRGGKRDQRNAWAQTRPKLNRLETRINSCSVHVIVTYRLKKVKLKSEEDAGGSSTNDVVYEVVGPEGVEYLYDLVADMTKRKELVVTKSRCSPLNDQVFRPLKHTYPALQLASEAKDTVVGMVDTLWAWLQGAPIPEAKQDPTPQQQAPPPATNGGEKQNPNKVFLAMQDEFIRIGEGALFVNTLADHGLLDHFKALKMDDQDPKIRDTAKMVWQLFKTLLPLKQAQYTANQLERVKQQEAQRAAGQHANGSTAGVSPAAAPAEGSTATAVESPKQQNEPEAEEEHVLDVSDFDRKELDQIFKTLKAHRGKIFTKPALFEEIMSFRGTRTEFLQRIEAEIGSNDGGSK